MSNTKFTPKPWHVSPDKESIRDADELPIAYTESDYHSTEEQDANGNLIAAAPELYEACKKAVDYIPAQMLTQQPWLDIVVALAKAEGRQS